MQFKEKLVNLLKKCRNFKIKNSVNNWKISIKAHDNSGKNNIIVILNHNDMSISKNVGAFAKLLHKKNVKIGRTRLFAWLREQKYLRQNNEPYQKWINSGIFQTREYVYLAKGEPCIGIKTYITGKGQTYLTEKIGKAY